MRAREFTTEQAPDGPIRAYHGTFQPTIERFAPLSHFGTRAAAEERLRFKGKREGRNQPGRIYQVTLDIKRPFRVKDFAGIHSPTHFAFDLRQAGLIDQEEMLAITRLAGEAGQSQALIRKLQDLGFDGMVYRNKYEDPGSESYVITDPNQVVSVKPVTQNSADNKIKVDESKQYVTRIDSKPVKDFAKGMQTYYHTKDFSKSGQFQPGIEIPKEYTGKMTGVYAGDPTFTALYATGNANQTRYVAKYGPGQPVVYFDRKDIPAMRSRRTYLTVFDGSRFKKLPTGEYFSSDPGIPVKQEEIADPFQYIKNQGWEFRIVDDLPAVLSKLQNLNKKDPSVRYGAEGMDLQENFADGRVKGKSRPGRVKRAGASCKGSVTDLRARAKKYGGERGRMYHWCANMKSGRRKSK